MGEEKPDTLDFVKDFQEYLSQQTQHVNMISGSVSGVKEADELPADCSQNGLDHPTVDMSLEDSSGILVDGFERTYDGKLKCRYCNYATRGTARLIEHIRIHTGEKPHRCHLCPFASAYERHLEAHMRSHTGEKPYKCELCSFRCSDRSNLSHHRRRRHKLLPMKGARSLSHKKMLSVLQKKASSLGYGRRLLINFSPPSMVVHKADNVNDFSHELPHLRQETYGNQSGAVEDGLATNQNHIPHDMIMDNPLNQLSTLAGQLASLPSESQALTQPPMSPGAESIVDEKPFLIQQPHPSTAPVDVTASVAHASSSSPITPEHRAPPHSNCSPGGGPCSEHSGRTSTPSVVSNSQPSTPAPGLSAPLQDHHALHHCQHCDIYFPDNILYTIHMGCHGYEKPFQCNICGYKCKSKYDFACHFARGQHK
ncbi:zinc finger protein Pegasus [Hippoglossus stenolepis]|uniref:zinc finger protein Pegasus n=1 Tax=Hippoglossus stenolepis TaxID=195615 RepID=UPI00159C5506|nr:zinc finger protein Pegasus [Hippoglossus stenolepis]